MVNEKKCSSLNISVTNDRGAVSFLCPNCGDFEIVRSIQARKIAAKYTCPKCGFVGPN